MVACARQRGTIALLAATLEVGGIARPVGAQIPCGYEVSAIIKGPFCAPFGYPTTIPQAIAEDGTVVGFYNVCTIGPSAPFRWTAQSGLVTLNVPFGYSAGSAWAIDDETGWIAGAMTPAGLNNPTAVVWMGNTPIDLGTLPGGNFSHAFGACGGRVVGKWGNTVTGPLQAFLWQDGVMMDLGPDLGMPNGEARDVNRRGQVVGWMGQSFLVDSHAFIWQDGDVLDLGVIPGGFSAYALAINDAEPAQVVGIGQVEQAGFTFGVARPFLWDGTRMLNLGILPGHDHGGASDIGAYKGVIQVVGGASGPAGLTNAFIWYDGVMTNLNVLIRGAEGVHVDGAHAINSAGQIVCEGTDSNADVVGIVLNPIDPPLGDLTCDGEVSRDDLEMLLAAWGPCPAGSGCPGDLNGNGMVDVIDLLIQLANWG